MPSLNLVNGPVASEETRYRFALTPHSLAYTQEWPSKFNRILLNLGR